MYCRFCGSKIDDDSLFCRACGKTTADEVKSSKRAQSKRPQGKYGRKKSKTPKVIGLIVGIVVIICAVTVGIVLFGGSGATIDETIALVQNGYLGEYTDITVKEILDSYYGMMYEEEIWDGGTTDSGTMLVEVQYYDEGFEEDKTIIRFTMLNEECFKISTFIDPLHPVEKETDFFAAMNYNYLVAHMGRNRITPGDLASEMELLGRLDGISGSAVKYGASATYGGNRAAICEIEGLISLDVSVTMLLDNYGLVDLTDYITTGTEDNLDVDVPTDTEPPETVVTEPTEPSTESNRVPWTETDEFWEFWGKYSACYDPMAGQYIGPVVDGRNLNFSIAALEDADGNRAFLLSYPLGGRIVESDGEYFEVADFVEFPTENHSFTNRSAMAIFTIDEYYPEYSGDFVISLQYTPTGIEYSIYANIPGVLDTKGETWIVDNVSDPEFE